VCRREESYVRKRVMAMSLGKGKAKKVVELQPGSREQPATPHHWRNPVEETSKCKDVY